MGVDMLLLDAKVDYFDHFSLSDLRSLEKAYKVIIFSFKVYGDSGSNQCAMVENLETLTEGRPCMSLVDLMSQPPTQTNV